MFNDSPKFIQLIQLIAAFFKILVFSYTNRFVYVKRSVISTLADKAIFIIIQLNFFFTDTNALAEARHRENQRRSDASVEHASVLPPDVLSVMTQCDQVEQDRESLHQQSHGKLMITIEKFFTKLEAEEKKYRARMEELEVCFLLKIKFATKMLTSVNLTNYMFYKGNEKQSFYYILK